MRNLARLLTVWIPAFARMTLWRRKRSKRLHIDHLAVAGAVEVGEPRLLREAHALIEAARAGIAVGRGGIGIDVLGTRLAHRRLGPGENLDPEPLPLLLRRHGNPIQIEGPTRSLDRPITGIGHERRPALGKHEVIAGSGALGEALRHELASD